VADCQRRLADRAERRLDKMEVVGQQQAEKDPAAAELLENAAKIGREDMLIREMKDTDEQLRSRDDKGKEAPQVNRAIAQQGSSIKTLQRMNEALQEQRKDEVERLVKKQKEERKNLDDLVERLQKLQKKVAQAK